MTQIAQSPTKPISITFAPAQAAINLLTAIANDPESKHQHPAMLAVEQWRSALATPAQIAMVDTDDELEIDSEGACVSMGDDPGFFIQTWTWVECPNGDSDTAWEPVAALASEGSPA